MTNAPATKSAFAALEAFNVALCAETGAGRGLATTAAAREAYHAALAARADEARALIAAARREPGGVSNRAYVVGMAATLDHAIAQAGA